MQASFNTADFSFANNQRDDTFPGAQLQSSASASQQYFMGSSQMAFSRNDGLDDNGNSYHSSYGWMSNSMQSGGWNSGMQAPSPSSNSRGLDSMSAWSDSGFRHSSSEFGNASGFGYVENDSSFGDYGCSQYRNQPTNSGCRDGIGQRNAWSDSGVNGNTAQVNLGNYTLDFNKSNSSMNLTNNQTGNKTKVWGDPHIDLNAGTSKQTSGMFNGPLTFTLPDHTHVSVGTQPARGMPNISYADNVTVTNGDRAYVVNGLSQQDSAPLTVQRSHDGFALAQQTPQNAMNLFANPGGTGWINANTDAPVKASDFA